MPVPKTIADSHYPDSCFHEAAGEEELLIKARRGIALNLLRTLAITFPDFWILRGNIESLEQAG